MIFTIPLAIVLFLCSYSFGEIEIEDQCQSFYLNCEDAEIAKSRNVIDNAPVSNYFDIFSGEYRFGILGDHIEERFPELTMRVDKRYVMKDKSTKFVQVTALDTNYIFMHLLVGLQQAIVDSERTDVNLANLDLKLFEYTQMLDRVIVSLSDKNLLNAPDIREKCNMSILEITSLQDEINHIQDIQSAAKRVIENRRSRREEMKRMQNDKFVHMWTTLNIQTLNVSNEKNLQINEILLEELESQFYLESKQMELAFEEEIMKLRMEIETVINTAKVRIEEESELERKNEDVHINIMNAKEESKRKASQEMIQVFFQEIGKYISVLMDNPKSVLLWSVNVLIVVGILVILIEILKESKHFLMKGLSPPFGVEFKAGQWSRIQAQSQAQLTSSTISSVKESIVSEPRPLIQWKHKLSGNVSYLEELVFPLDIECSLLSIAAILSEQNIGNNQQSFHNQNNNNNNNILSYVSMTLMNSIGIGRSVQSSFLPNIVITGPGGSGKTAVAKAIVESCGLPYATICGADLEAHGSRASAYLRELLDSCASRHVGKPCLLVIDDPESIIRARGERDSGGRQQQGISYCLYVLMGAIRENSRRFGIVITTSEPLHNIDDALMDRYTDTDTCTDTCTYTDTCTDSCTYTDRYLYLTAICLLVYLFVYSVVQCCCVYCIQHMNSFVYCSY